MLEATLIRPDHADEPVRLGSLSRRASGSSRSLTPQPNLTSDATADVLRGAVRRIPSGCSPGVTGVWFKWDSNNPTILLTAATIDLIGSNHLKVEAAALYASFGSSQRRSSRRAAPWNAGLRYMRVGFGTVGGLWVTPASCSVHPVRSGRTRPQVPIRHRSSTRIWRAGHSLTTTSRLADQHVGVDHRPAPRQLATTASGRGRTRG